MPGEQVVILEKQGPVAWITLNRPHAINAINDDVRAAFPRALTEADRDPEVRVVVLTGAGPRGFCAGADIKEFRDVDSLPDRRQKLVHQSWAKGLEECRKPVIAAIHGYCLGGGLEIAANCDIRVASTDAIFGFPEVGLGLITGAGGSLQLMRLIGIGRALDLFLTTDRINAEEAYRIGLVTRLASPENLREVAATLASRIAKLPPMAVTFAKELLRQGGEMDLSSGKRLEASLFALLLATEDRVEAAAAFREKRPPVFRGK